MTRTIHDPRELKAYRKQALSGQAVGFVPTMGGLHEGHVSLIRRSLRENDATIASVYLNRTQFNSPEDFEGYPADFAEDQRILADLGVDAIFAPSYEEMYPDAYRYRVTEMEKSLTLEGESRPGHFDGVLTVVLKLLNLAQPQRAYFGEKDFQQFDLVRGMAQAFLSTLRSSCAQRLAPRRGWL